MKKQYLIGLKCNTCGQIYDVNGSVQSLCPMCPPLHATLECIFDYNAIKTSLEMNPLQNRRDMSIFRYMELLPVLNPDAHVPLQIGWSPLYASEAGAEKMGLKHLLIKDDSQNPTASYKDRASALAVARAAELGYSAICTASTGNAAASLAACCRAVHFPCIVFVPEKTPAAKLIQMLAYGAIVFRVEGSYDDAFDISVKACETFDWMNRSAGYNPYLVEGKKTGAWELAEQTGFNLPDTVFVSVGDGSIISGLCKGFQELHQLDYIPHRPCVIGVQAAGANALVRAWNRYAETGVPDIDTTIKPSTIADSISVGVPREGIRALRMVKATDGFFMDVSDEDILTAMRRLPLETAVMGEPAAAVAYAGLIKAREKDYIEKNTSAAVFITGSGLKDTAAAETAWRSSPLNTIKPGPDVFNTITHILRDTHNQ
jgi:threonine synthase